APVALFFGRDSLLNPYTPNLDPELLEVAGLPEWFAPIDDPDEVFKRSYPSGHTVDIITGTHGKFFNSPNIETLSRALRRRLTDLHGEELDKGGA
ncbi:MAG: hypothetical protein AAF441_19475, partial [Pseudomonadota bacterium]